MPNFRENLTPKPKVSIAQEFFALEPFFVENMTTITIHNANEEQIDCQNTQEAMEALAEMSGFKILWKIGDEGMIKQLKTDYLETKDRPFESFDNI